MAIQYNSNYDLTIPFSDVSYQVACSANVEETITIPGTSTNYYSMKLNYNADANVFVCLNSTPTIPSAGTVGSQQYNEYRAGCDGSQRYVRGGDVVHFITPDTSAYIGVSLRQLPGQ